MTFRNLKLATKQILGFGFILAVMAGVNVYSINRMADIRAEIDEVSANWLPRAIATADIHLSTIDLRLKQLQHAFAPDDARKQEQADVMITLIDRINANVDTYEELKSESEQRNLYSANERALYSEFDQKLEAYQDLSITFFMLSRSNETQAALDLLNGEARTVYQEISDILERLVSVNKQDALLAAERAEATYRSTRTISIVLLLATVIISALLAALIVRYMTGPVRHLVRAARNVADGDLDGQLAVESNDEIGRLAQSFNLMTISLRDARERTQRETQLRAEAAELKIKATEAEAKALLAENERTTHELEQARKLQLSMLPKSLPQIEDLDIAVYMKTATEVGGDYYDFRVGADNSLTIAVGDATGHGLQAGTMVAATKSLFNALADSTNPVGILTTTSRALEGLGFDQMYMAMMLAKLRARTLLIASAGMPPALVYRSQSGEVDTILLKGMPLGSHFEFPYTCTEVTLESQDSVLFMSDGLPERFNGDGEMLGYETATALFKQAGHLPPAEIIDRLVQAEQEWAGDRPRDDDMTFVAFRVN